MKELNTYYKTSNSTWGGILDRKIGYFYNLPLYKDLPFFSQKSLLIQDSFLLLK